MIPCLLFIKLQTWFTKELGVGVSFVVLVEIRYKFGAVTRISIDQPLQIAGGDHR